MTGATRALGGGPAPVTCEGRRSERLQKRLFLPLQQLKKLLLNLQQLKKLLLPLQQLKKLLLPLQQLKKLPLHQLKKLPQQQLKKLLLPCQKLKRLPLPLLVTKLLLLSALLQHLAPAVDAASPAAAMTG